MVKLKKKRVKETQWVFQETPLKAQANMQDKFGSQREVDSMLRGICNTGINYLNDGVENYRIKLAKDEQLKETSGVLENRVRNQRYCEKLEKSSKWQSKIQGKSRTSSQQNYQFLVELGQQHLATEQSFEMKISPKCYDIEEGKLYSEMYKQNIIS